MTGVQTCALPICEESIYTYNGLGALMEQTWIIAKNGYGYHGVDAVETPEPDVPDPDEPTKPVEPEDPDVPDPGVNNEGNGNNNGSNGNGHVNGNNGNHYGNQEENPEEETVTTSANGLTATLVTYGNAGNGNNGNNGNGNGNQDKPTGSNVKKTSTVVKQFVADFSSETYKPLMEHEVNGLDYRYVYSDKARLSVVVQGIDHGSASLLDSRNELHAYYHCDYLGTTDYLTSAVNSKIISWTSYSEWGEISHNAVLKCGQRELDLVKEYATHDFDAVLNMYYAKARFYDADNRRFTAVDPILDPSRYDLREYVTDPMQLVQTLYVKDNAVSWIDPYGLWTLAFGSTIAAAFGLQLGGNAQYVIDGHGNIGKISGIAFGAGTPSASASFLVTITNADTIFDLAGGSYTAGGSLFSGGGEIFSDGNGTTGINISFLSVGPIPAELHANFSYGFVTETLTSKLLKEPIYLAAKWYFETLTCEQQDYLKSNFGVNFEEPTFKAKGNKKHQISIIKKYIKSPKC